LIITSPAPSIVVTDTISIACTIPRSRRSAKNSTKITTRPDPTPSRTHTRPGISGRASCRVSRRPPIRSKPRAVQLKSALPCLTVRGCSVPIVRSRRASQNSVTGLACPSAIAGHSW
jgi:hypothetical protein